MAFTYTRVGARGNLSGFAVRCGKASTYTISDISDSPPPIMRWLRSRKLKFNFILLYSVKL